MNNARLRILFPFLTLAVLASCGVNDNGFTAASFSPYRRAVSLIPFYFQQGLDSSSDACLAVILRTNYGTTNSLTSWQARAAFNEGSTPVQPQSSAFGGQSMEWKPDQYVYEHYSSVGLLSSDWQISGYGGSDINTKDSLASPISPVGLKMYDTISRSQRLAIKYAGAQFGKLYLYNQFLPDTGRPTESNSGGSDIAWISGKDTGSIVIPADSMKAIPAGSIFRLSLWHDKFYITPDTKGRRIGHYSSHESVWYFYIKE